MTVAGFLLRATRGGDGSRSETEGASASVHGLALAEAVLGAQMLDIATGAGFEVHAGAR